MSINRYSRFVELLFFNDTAPTEIYTLSLHDALPISGRGGLQHRVRIDALSAHVRVKSARAGGDRCAAVSPLRLISLLALLDRKSTRLNSSHANISYAVFCLKKKTLMLHLIFYDLFSI